MPIKRRKSKARPEEVKAWAMYFQSGCDFFGELVDAGIVPEGHVPTEEFARETWHRIGHDVIEYIAQLYRSYTPPERPFWAEEMFGSPGGR